MAPRALLLAVCANPELSAQLERLARSQGLGVAKLHQYLINGRCDMSQLPQALAERLGSGRYQRAAVGSCPAAGQEGTFTAYRVAVLLY